MYGGTGNALKTMGRVWRDGQSTEDYGTMYGGMGNTLKTVDQCMEGRTIH